MAGSGRKGLTDRCGHLTVTLEAFGIPLKDFKLRNNTVRFGFRSITVAVEREIALTG